MHPFQNRSIMDYDFGTFQGKGDYGTKSAAALEKEVEKSTPPERQELSCKAGMELSIT